MYVYLDASADDVHEDQPGDRTDLLIATLREQLQAERQAHAEARRLLAALERIPAIEAPADERDAPETVEEQQGGVSPGPVLGALRQARSAARGCVGC